MAWVFLKIPLSSRCSRDVARQTLEWRDPSHADRPVNGTDHTPTTLANDMGIDFCYGLDNGMDDG